MKTIFAAALSSALVLGLSVAAQAQSIPTPANPTPEFPVATNGTPLPVRAPYSNGAVFSGRSAFSPYDALAGRDQGYVAR